MTRTAFVGLGAMGSRLARRLLEARHPVAGYNRTPGKARALEAAGLKLAATPRAAAEGAVAVFSMVTDDTALRAVALGDDGIVAGLGRGAVWAEMSTVSPAVTRELGEVVAARGAAMLDTPISGSTITVEQGAASIAVGGEREALERVRPYLAAMAPGGITHVGPLGLAKTMKIATNLGLAVQMLALDEAHATGVTLPTTALVQQWLTMARALGLGERDFGTLFDVLAGLSGLPPSPNT